MFNTGNPVPSSDAKDLSDNAENFDDAINLQSDTWTDRRAITRDTVNGRIKKMGYTVPIAYAGGELFTVNDNVKTVNEGAIVYAPLPSALPFTTSGTFVGDDDSRFFVIQGVTDNQLIDDITQSYSFQNTDLMVSSVILFPLGKQLTVFDASYTTVTDATAAADGFIVDGVENFQLQNSISAILNKVRKITPDNFGLSNTAKKIWLDNSDIYILAQGDSTGDENDEWVRLTAENMALKYQSHSVSYISWNNGTDLWNSPVSVQTGSGSNTIHIYNGSVSGSIPAYWSGTRKALAYDSLIFDTIISNFGLNIPTPYESQLQMMSEYIYMLRDEQPLAEILLTIQAKDRDLIPRTENRIKAAIVVAEAFGIRVIDVYSLYIELIASTGGNETPWYADALHPSSAASLQWGLLATDSILNNKLGGNNSIKNKTLSPCIIPNCDFTRWLGGNNASPTYWELAAGATALRDTINFETYGNSARFVGIGTSGSGTVSFKADHIFDQYSGVNGLVLAARIFTNGSTGKAGRLFAAHTISGSRVEISAIQGIGDDVEGAFRWAFLIIPKSFYDGESDFEIGILSGEASEYVSIDRIVISSSLNVSDLLKKSDFVQEFILSDSQHTVLANSTTSRNFSSSNAVFNYGMFSQLSFDNDVTGVIINSFVTSTGVTVTYTNTTALDIDILAGDYYFNVK